MIQGSFSLLFVFVCMASLADADYQAGDFVPMARRAQFLGTRTQWHDVLGRHCPRFGQDSTVVVPLPKPVGLGQNDDYKLSLSFEGERFVTPWVAVLGFGVGQGANPIFPMLRVDLVNTGAHLGPVRTTLMSAPAALAEEHKDILAEFHNASVWPKHLLVSYAWREESELNPVNALNVLLGIGTLMMLLMFYNVMATYHNKVSSMITELADEDGEAEKKD